MEKGNDKMIESGYIKMRWFEVFYSVDYNKTIKDKKENITDETIFNTYFTVHSFKFCKQPYPFLYIRTRSAKLWAWLIHKIIFHTAGENYE